MNEKESETRCRSQVLVRGGVGGIERRYQRGEKSGRLQAWALDVSAESVKPLRRVGPLERIRLAP